MLSNLSIKGLYGLYSYSIPLSTSEEDVIRFITGPNGYGKTTILSVLNALYTNDMQQMFSVQFDEIVLVYGEGYKVRVEQQQHYIEDQNDDERKLEKTTLHFDFLKKTADDFYTKLYSIDMDDHDMESDAGLGTISLSLFFSSYKVYYVRDNRLWANVGDTSRLKKNVDEMTKLLANESLEINRHITDCLQQNANGGNSGVDIAANDTVLDLNEFGIVSDKMLVAYKNGDEGYKRKIDGAISSLEEKDKAFIKRLKAFRDIIRKSEFANKSMQINPRYGYRFVATDEARSILSTNMLSSGEKHLLIMSFELLFVADDDSLILIDEPELSFHIQWQVQFLNNLRMIANLRHLQFIVCTHSPEVLGNEWNIAVDLYTQSQQNQ